MFDLHWLEVRLFEIATSVLVRNRTVQPKVCLLVALMY